MTSIGEWLLGLVDELPVNWSAFHSQGQRTLSYGLCEENAKGTRTQAMFITTMADNPNLPNMKISDLIDIVLWCWSTLTWEDTVRLCRIASYFINEYSIEGRKMTNPPLNKNGTLIYYALSEAFNVYSDKIYSCSKREFDVCKKHLMEICRLRKYQFTLLLSLSGNRNVTLADILQASRKPMTYNAVDKRGMAWSFDSKIFETKLPDNTTVNLSAIENTGNLVLYGIIRTKEMIISLMNSSLDQWPHIRSELYKTFEAARTFKSISIPARVELEKNPTASIKSHVSSSKSGDPEVKTTPTSPKAEEEEEEEELYVLDEDS